MGLAGDPALSRSRGELGPVRLGLSNSGRFSDLMPGSSSSGITRLGSDGSDLGGENFVSSGCFVNCDGKSGSFDLVNSVRVEGNGGIRSVLVDRSPAGKDSIRVDGVGCDSVDQSGSLVDRAGTDGGRGSVEEVCRIKNLDNGKEFVVHEVSEDGMWNKLKEVETDKQLTMEEFDMTVGHSPIVQELMRRRNVEEGISGNLEENIGGGGGSRPKPRKKGGWFKGIRSVASSMTGYKERRSSDDRDSSSEKSGQRSSSATDGSQDLSFHGPERIKVRQYGKSCKELTAMYNSQDIHGHNGSIWTIKFSLDGRYLASAGENCDIHIWQVVELERKGDIDGQTRRKKYEYVVTGQGVP